LSRLAVNMKAKIKKEVSKFTYSTVLIYGGKKVKEKRRYKDS
jgi:hypothetical protein